MGAAELATIQRMQERNRQHRQRIAELEGALREIRGEMQKQVELRPNVTAFAIIELADNVLPPTTAGASEDTAAT